ncbi:unnamed protein product [Cuscuta epithymum]|uniref:Luciferase-like domain-containing protein n=1 Tax=Cuscuta epithymum TaxID=186058 RepID=A0AAV0G7V8_9ASTE|nr:unnamed protein product [Cuscuta epithymum]
MRITPSLSPSHSNNNSEAIAIAAATKSAAAAAGERIFFSMDWLIFSETRSAYEEVRVAAADAGLVVTVAGYFGATIDGRRRLDLARSPATPTRSASAMAQSATVMARSATTASF